jgi:hypothetical protein
MVLISTASGPDIAVYQIQSQLRESEVRILGPRLGSSFPFVNTIK